MNYESYKKFLEAKMEEFDKTVALFGVKYSDDETPNMYGVSKSFIDAQFKEIFSQALLEAVEAGIASAVVKEKLFEVNAQTSDMTIGWHTGRHDAIAKAEKQSRSWLEK